MNTEKWRKTPLDSPFPLVICYIDIKHTAYFEFEFSMATEKNVTWDFDIDTIEMEFELKMTSCQPPHSFMLANSP